ncbi:MAG: lipoate--protein ligase [Oscillospiraceae bacterium]|nr:lipoate--protein ligase [Oscillospiraceae bacterium]
MKLSYLNLTTTDPAFNLATEEYVFDYLPKDRTYFMLWQNDNAIIIGKHQNTLAEINLNFVNEHNIKVVRRLSGGGAVYHDLGNLNFTFITDAKQQESINFKLFCQPIVRTLEKLGVYAQIGGRNDITIDGQKFSGNSQYIRDGRVLHHGTILFQSDLTVVSKALQVDPAKIQAKGIKSVRSRVTNVADHLPSKIDLEAFRNLLLQHLLEEQPGDEYVLTKADLAKIENISQERYATWQWNFGRSLECTTRKKMRFEGCGTIEANITVDHGIISQISFTGDFFSVLEPENLAKLFVGKQPDPDVYKEILNNIDVAAYFVGITNEQFLTLMTQ